MFAKKHIGERMRERKIVSVATGRRHVLRDVVLDNCVFDSVSLGKPTPSLRGEWHEFRQVRAVSSLFRNCIVERASLENVTLSNCTAPEGGLVLLKCILDRTVFSGDYETLRVVPPPDGTYATRLRNRAGGDDASLFAVDVREAAFGEIEILGIPPELVKYDESLGGRLSRAVLETAGWPIAEVSDYFAGIMLKFKAYGGSASVYIVPSAGQDSAALLTELSDLKARGWVQ